MQAGCQINPIDMNFHLQTSLEIFDKNSADKIWPKKYKEVRVPERIYNSHYGNGVLAMFTS
jgi:hypothetical protein